MDIIDYFKKYHLVLIISLLILIIYSAMALSAPDFSPQPIQLDKLSVDIPADAAYDQTIEGLEITGPYEQYISEIIMTNTSLNVFNEAMERGSPSVKSYNDTHYLIRTEPDGLDSEIDIKYYNFYDFIVPKEDFNETSHQLMNENIDIIMIKGNYQEIVDFLEDSIKMNGEG